MTQSESVPESGRMSDNAVHAATGKNWDEWLSIMDAAGAAGWTHKQIVAFLHDEHGVGAWWQQMVTVEYERARGLRAKHERPDGFQVSVSKTLSAPVQEAFEAWNDRERRTQWMKQPDFTVRKATPAKSMRITWIDGQTSLEINFYEKGPGRSQVVAQHSKLQDSDMAAEMKAYWAADLNRLKAYLEGG
jgi:uncharacterized protein YndB with AHSA1/START domain